MLQNSKCNISAILNFRDQKVISVTIIITSHITFGFLLAQIISPGKNIALCSPGLLLGPPLTNASKCTDARTSVMSALFLFEPPASRRRTGSGLNMRYSVIFTENTFHSKSSIFL